MNIINVKNKLFIFILCLFSVSSQAEIYKWIDDQGKTHYGDKPVENARELEVNIEKLGHITTSAARTDKRQKLLETYDEDRKRENKEKAKQKKQKKQNERSCVVAKDRLRGFERASYLYDLDKDGNRVVMSNEARQKTTIKLRNRINKVCR